MLLFWFRSHVLGDACSKPGINSVNPACETKLHAHWKSFSALWRQYDRLCNEITFSVPTILEWPRSCAYWQEKHVNKRLSQNSMIFADFDGCQFDLHSSRKGEDALFLKKPWRFATNIPQVHTLFNNHKCPGQSSDHVHGHTNGVNAIASQYYTPAIVLAIHLAIYQNYAEEYNWINM